jgi:cobalt/nickel transport system permease protein
MTFDLYTNIDGNSPLHRLDARIKVIVTIAAILGVVIMLHWAMPLIVLAFCLGLLVYSRAPWKIYLKRLLYPSYIIIFVAIVQPFMVVSNNVVMRLPILGWPLYDAGIKFGLLIFTRCLSAVAVVNLLILVTPMEEILDSLRWFRVPSVITDTMLLMFRYISLISDESTRIRKAQESRLGYSKKVGISTKISNFGTMAGMLMARSFDRAIQVGDAMVSRCYTGTSNLFAYSTKKVRRKDSLIGVLAVLGIVGLYFIDMLVA